MLNYLVLFDEHIEKRLIWLQKFENICCFNNNNNKKNVIALVPQN